MTVQELIVKKSLKINLAATIQTYGVSDLNGLQQHICEFL